MTSHPIEPARSPRPSRDDIDIFGMSHQGLEREDNQDHFMVASLHKTMQVYQTSLPEDELGPLISPSRGYVFLVADGLGGGPGGQRASQTALRVISDYVTQAVDLYARIEPESEQIYVQKLRRSLEKTHEVLRAEGARDADSRGMATTLTMVTVHWPRAYVIHVGDSRCYRFRGGVLEQLTKDQTMAQAMLEAGAMRPDQLEQSRLKHVLWSALGGKEASPLTLTVDCEWDDIMLLCTDGLTKHVSDPEIGEQLQTLDSAEAMCRALVDLALARGGSDNVTVVVGRLRSR